MRYSLIVVLTATAVLSPADTIYLKNGRTIVADRVREADGRIQYEVGDNTYAIPKSVVLRVETGPGPESAGPRLEPAQAAGAPAAKAPAEVPTFSPADKFVPSDPLFQKVIHDGKVDPDALRNLESEGNDAAAAGYFLAGRYEYQKGSREQARFYLERARIYAPENTVVLNYYAAVLVQLGRPSEAIAYADRSTRLAPNASDGFTVLGFAYYSDNRTAEAIPAWKRSLELRPDDTVKAYLAKAQREAAAEAQFTESDSGHFTIRYEGATTSSVLRQQIQETLEHDYDQLVSELAIVPRNNISVSLYTQQAFFDVTQAPAWIGAINDGKLRIPIQGLAAMTPALQKVLKHELAHSFINQTARGRCPQWLNEGIAQLVEPKSIGAKGQRLAQLYAAGRQIPLSQLEASFLSYSPAEALLVYDEALAAAEFIRDTYGVNQLHDILEHIGAGESTDAALQATLHLSYADFEQFLGQYLANKYGN